MNYALFKYYHDNPQIEIKEDMVFYRKINIPIKDLYSYYLFEGKIICFGLNYFNFYLWRFILF